MPRAGDPTDQTKVTHLVHDFGHFLGLGGVHENLIRHELNVPVTNRSRFFMSALVTVGRMKCSSSKALLFALLGQPRTRRRSLLSQRGVTTGIFHFRPVGMVVPNGLGHFGIALLATPSQLFGSLPVLFAGRVVRVIQCRNVTTCAI
jgi:hypothetical protein